LIPEKEQRTMTVQEQKLIPMSNKTSKKKSKRLSKGQRAHVRRLKQEARITGIVYKPTGQPK
jgi:hypothetical protein